MDGIILLMLGDLFRDAGLQLVQLFQVIWGYAVYGVTGSFLAGVITRYIYHYGNQYVFEVSCWLCWISLIVIIITLIMGANAKPLENPEDDKTRPYFGAFFFALVLCFHTSSFGGFIEYSHIHIRVFSWAIWAMLLTLATGMIIPNFNKKRAWWVGFFGGVVASLLYIYCTSKMGEVAGRYAGAVILGVAIGILVGILRTSKVGSEGVEECEVIIDGHAYTVPVGKETVTIGTASGCKTSLRINEEGELETEVNGVSLNSCNGLMCSDRVSVSRKK
ncbi:MAG: hypothetical protein Q4C70_08710 [Planctomycetia bacterium]|nr:hypothetical protein [Planctomycetia bacterium]